MSTTTNPMTASDASVRAGKFSPNIKVAAAERKRLRAVADDAAAFLKLASDASATSVNEELRGAIRVDLQAIHGTPDEVEAQVNSLIERMARCLLLANNPKLRAPIKSFYKDRASDAEKSEADLKNRIWVDGAAAARKAADELEEQERAAAAAAGVAYQPSATVQGYRRRACEFEANKAASAEKTLSEFGL